MQPVVLSIAASDAVGAAGAQADLKSIAANGALGASVITAVTAKGSKGVFYSEPVSRAMLRAQLQTVLLDLPVVAVKTGLLLGADSIKEVVTALKSKPPMHVVCDPDSLTRDSIDALWRDLFPITSLVTPTVHEAELLTGRSIVSEAEAQRAGEHILESGVGAVLIKGNSQSPEQSSDVLVTADRVQIFHGKWISASHARGIGCVYSAAIASQLAFGLPLVEAIAVAKEFVGATLAHQGQPFFSLHDEGAAAVEWRGRVQRNWARVS